MPCSSAASRADSIGTAGFAAAPDWTRDSSCGLDVPSCFSSDRASGSTFESVRAFFRRYHKTPPRTVRRRAQPRIAPTAAPAFAPADRCEEEPEAMVLGVTVTVYVGRGVARFKVDDAAALVLLEVVVVKSEGANTRAMGQAHACPGP